MTRSNEDTLRRLLRDEAETVRPTATFGGVQARRRTLDRRAWAARAAAVVAVVGLGAGTVTVLASGSSEDVRVTTPGPGTTEAPAPAAPVEDEPVGIWPYVSAADADAAPTDGLGDDPLATADAFLTGIAGFREGYARTQETMDDDVASVTIRVGRSPRETTVNLVRMGKSGRWTVTAVESTGLAIDEPAAGADVQSPLQVRGRATAVEGTVLVEVYERHWTEAEAPLGSAVATAGQGEMHPFDVRVAVGDAPSGLAVVFASTTSAEDGAVEQLSAVPVRLPPDGDRPVALPSGEPLAEDEVVAVLRQPGNGDPDSHDVVVIDVEGLTRRVLVAGISTAEGGVLDLAVTPDRRTALVAASSSACESRLLAVALQGDSQPVEIGSGDAVAVSPDNRRLAVATDHDCDGHGTIEIRELRTGEVTGRFGDGGRSTDALSHDIDPELVARVTALMWADPQTVVHQVQYEDGSALYVLTVDSGADRRIGPSDRPAREWVAPAGMDGRLTVVERCCEPTRTTSARILVIDTGGAVLQDLDDLQADEVTRLLWWGDDAAWLTDAGELYRMTDGQPRLVRRGVAGAAR